MNYFGKIKIMMFIYTKKEVPVHLDKNLTLEKRRLPTLPHCIAVPSAMSGLTSLFGMGRGGTPTL